MSSMLYDISRRMALIQLSFEKQVEDGRVDVIAQCYCGTDPDHAVNGTKIFPVSIDYSGNGLKALLILSSYAGRSSIGHHHQP